MRMSVAIRLAVAVAVAVVVAAARYQPRRLVRRRSRPG